MSDRVYVYDQLQDPHKTFLYYYDRWDTYFWKDADTENGRQLRVFDTNDDRLISYEEVGEDPLLFVDLVRSEGVEAYFADSARDAQKMLPPIKWQWMIWDYGRIYWGTDNKIEPYGGYEDGISPKAKQDVLTLNEEGIDINGDGYLDRIQFYGCSLSKMVFCVSYEVSLFVLWGGENGYSYPQPIYNFDLGEQATGIEWYPPGLVYNDLNSLLVHISANQWRTSRTIRMFASNAAPTP